MLLSQIKFNAPVRVRFLKDDPNGYRAGEIWSLSPFSARAARLQPRLGWNPLPPKAAAEVEVVR